MSSLALLGIAWRLFLAPMAFSEPKLPPVVR